VHNLQTIFKTFIAKDADIPYHPNNIKLIWENVSKLSGMHYNFSDEFFKLIITCILPPLWYTFAKAYMGSETNLYCNNPKHSVSSQEFLGILISEYHCQHSHAKDYHPDNNSIKTSNITMSHNWQGQQKGKGPLITCIMPSTASTFRLLCKLCKSIDHKTDNCQQWDSLLCKFCNKLSHTKDNCWNKHCDKRPPNFQGNHNAQHLYTQQTNEAETQIKETEQPEQNQYVCIAEINENNTAPSNKSTMTTENVTLYNNKNQMETGMEIGMSGMAKFDEYSYANKTTVVGYDNNEDAVSIYTWIANSATTSHICNACNAFVDYTPAHTNVPIYSVRGVTACAQGQGIVKIQSQYKQNTYTIILNDMLHVPTN
jgi:hypothetical protein